MELLTPENVNKAFWISMGVGAVVGLVQLKIIPIIMVIVSLLTLHYATRTPEGPEGPSFDLAPAAQLPSSSATPYTHTISTDVAKAAIQVSHKVHKKENPFSRKKLYDHMSKMRY